MSNILTQSNTPILRRGLLRLPDGRIDYLARVICPEEGWYERYIPCTCRPNAGRGSLVVSRLACIDTCGRYATQWSGELAVERVYSDFQVVDRSFSGEILFETRPVPVSCR